MGRQRDVVLATVGGGFWDRAAKGMAQTGRVIRRKPPMAFGLGIISLMTIVSLLAPLVAVYDPKELHMADRLQAPSERYWFGTDAYGRDVYSMTAFGGRVSLVVGLTVAALTVSIGALLGCLTGFYRRLDAVLMRVLDGLMAIPSILLAMALVAMLGASMRNVIVALTVVEIPRVVRIARASVLSLREQPFVEATRAIGASPGRILMLHILPNIIAPVIVMGTYICATAILVEANLSFLGAGTPPHIPSWGNIMAQGRGFIQRAMWIIVFPGIALALVVLSINLIGDGLRDTLDPKLARRM